jgi:hypothetical protein
MRVFNFSVCIEIALCSMSVLRVVKAKDAAIPQGMKRASRVCIVCVCATGSWG